MGHVKIKDVNREDFCNKQKHLLLFKQAQNQLVVWQGLKMAELLSEEQWVWNRLQCLQLEQTIGHFKQTFYKTNNLWILSRIYLQYKWSMHKHK